MVYGLRCAGANAALLPSIYALMGMLWGLMLPRRHDDVQQKMKMKMKIEEEEGEAT